MTSRAHPFEPFYQYQRLREERPFPHWQQTEPHPRHQFGLSQVLRPDDDQVRAKNKAFSRLSRKEQGVHGHSRELASMFKSKVLSPAQTTAHLGPPLSAHSWPRSISLPWTCHLPHLRALPMLLPAWKYPTFPTSLSRPLLCSVAASQGTLALPATPPSPLRMSDSLHLCIPSPWHNTWGPVRRCSISACFRHGCLNTDSEQRIQTLGAFSSSCPTFCRRPHRVRN